MKPTRIPPVLVLVLAVSLPACGSPRPPVAGAKEIATPSAKVAGPDDPRFVLIGVDIHAAVFLEVDKPQPVVLFEIAKGWLTGDTPELGELHRIEA